MSPEVGTDAEATTDDRQPQAYVTEIWWPPADNGVHALHSHMREPEPLPEPEPEAEDMTEPEAEACRVEAVQRR